MKIVHRSLLIIWAFGLLGCPPAIAAQTPVQVPVQMHPLPPDVASYTITVRYDPASHTLTGEQSATYHNLTETAIPDLVFHLYLNAFQSAETRWMQEGGLISLGRGYDPTAPGWIRVQGMRLDDGTPLSPEPVDTDATLIHAVLPHAVAPGQKVTVHIEFTAQLPKVLARTGWADGGDFVMAGQWFPKFGVWEAGAWNAHPFHANSEFYADFGRYDVTLTLPKNWIVASTGTAGSAPQTGGDTTTHTLIAEHVIDFAWAASPDFHDITAEVDGVTVRVVYPPERQALARRALAAITGALPHYNAWYGPYGQGIYPQLTVVVVPQDAGGAGGMEYPTLFTVGGMGGDTPRCIRLLEVETVHELAHQWFQSVVATNEAEAPWLDEGFTDYSTIRAMDALYEGAVFDCGGWDFSYLAMRRMEYLMMPDTRMSGRAWDFDSLRYGVAAYAKPALALTTLERVVGEEAMLSFLRTYVARYSFSHPTGTDVRALMIESLGDDVATWFFDGLVDSEGTLDAQVSLSGAGFTVERRGALCIPTGVSVARRASQGTETRPWPCDAPSLTVDGSVETVHIDPDNTIVVDQNLANNGLHRAPDVAAWLGGVTRWIRLLQDLFWGGAAW